MLDEEPVTPPTPTSSVQPPRVQRRYSVDVVTRSYRAPELLVQGLFDSSRAAANAALQAETINEAQQEPGDPTGGTPVDIWSAGCVLGEMLVRCLARREGGSDPMEEDEPSVTPVLTASAAGDDAEGVPLALFPRVRKSRSESGGSELLAAAPSLDMTIAIGHVDVTEEAAAVDMAAEALEAAQQEALDACPSEQLSNVLRVVGLPLSALEQWRQSARQASHRASVASVEAAAKFLEVAQPMRPRLSDRFAALADPQALDLVSRMLEVDPHKRLTCAEALAHPFLQLYVQHQQQPPRHRVLSMDARSSINALGVAAEECDEPRKLQKLIQREADACSLDALARQTNG